MLSLKFARLFGRLLVFSFSVLSAVAQSPDPDEGLFYRDPEVRRSSADFIKATRRLQSFPRLLEAYQKEDNIETKKHMLAAMEAISGSNFGTDEGAIVNEATKWWENTGKKLLTESTSSEETKKLIDTFELRMGIATMIAIGLCVLFLATMFYLVGSIASKLKEWKQLARATETYVKEANTVSAHLNRATVEIEDRKNLVMSTLKQAEADMKEEIERYIDITQRELEHSLRDEVMELRKKAEAELGQTLEEIRKSLKDENMRMTAETKEKVKKVVDELHSEFMKQVESNKLFLEASFYAANNRHHEALAIYNKLLSIDPVNYVALLNVGDIYMRMMKYEDALSFYKRAAACSKDSADALYRLAAAYAKMKYKDEMLESLSRAIKYNAEYKDEALNDTSFREYWNDPVFRNLVEV